MNPTPTRHRAEEGMRSTFAGRFTPVLAAIVSTVVTAPAEAQIEVRSRAVELNITGRVHTQYATTSVAGEPSSEFILRRARFTADLRVNDFVSGRVQPDYGEGKITLKDAYLRMTFSPTFRATVGQFKRPFDLFQLTSSTQTLVIERTGGVAGADVCAGPGGICSLSRFTEKLQYSDRDVGIQIDGRSGRFGYQASVTNGTGANAADENGAKSYTGRVGFSPAGDITIAGNLGVHDYLDLTGATEYATAIGGDIEIGNFNEGLHARAGFVAGDNWRNLQAGSATSFLTAQGIVTYKMAVAGSPYVSAIEPVGRLSWGDPDTNLGQDDGWLLTPGFVAHFTGRNKVAANVDIWTPAAGNTEWSFKMQWYFHF